MSDQISHGQRFITYSTRYLHFLNIMRDKHPAWQALRNVEKYNICVAYRNQASNNMLTLPTDAHPDISKGYQSAIRQLDVFSSAYYVTRHFDTLQDFWKSAKRKVADTAQRKAALVAVLVPA